MTSEYQNILNATVQPDFQDNKIADFYSLSRFPTRKNASILKPVIISYTSEGALFEIKVSALNTKQLQILGDLL